MKCKVLIPSTEITDMESMSHEAGRLSRRLDGDQRSFECAQRGQDTVFTFATDYTASCFAIHCTAIGIRGHRVVGGY